MSKKPAGFNIGSKWVKFMSVGCSHGAYIDPSAEAAVLEFKASWKPDLTVHLGDAIDMTAFMGNARAVGSTGAAPIQPDVDEGLRFLRLLRPNFFLLGNHEDRAWNMRSDPNAVIAHCAHKVVQEIQEECAKMGAKIVEHNGIFQIVKKGNVGFTHGTFFNELSPRNYAEAYAGLAEKLIFAHTHKAGQMNGRTVRPTTGYCVGTLTRRASMEYAKKNISTAAWSQGIVAGEIREGRNPQSAVWLFQRNPGEEWRLPL